MWSLLAVIFCVSIKASLAYVSANYYCADVNPQLHVNIEQLMGMWYGIEIITHTEKKFYIRPEPSCPILHISEDKQYYTTPNPLYKNYDYRYNYGERVEQNRQYQYGRTTPYPHNRHNYQQRYGEHRNYREDMKRLRIWWDENGTGTEYHLKYNITRPGFWISSGPQNGSELEPLYSNFAGTVQVIKAVGDHLVLTFCHQMPERQLMTILLSRENTLDYPDIHNVHNMLIRRGLGVDAIKQVCANGGGTVGFFILQNGLIFVFLSIIIFFTS